MPSPEVHDPKFWEDFWGWLLAAGGGLLVAVRHLAKRVRSGGGEPAWVDRVVGALVEVRETVERVNEATTQNIRSVLTLYGKDVTEIRSAQERMSRELDEMKNALEHLRTDVAVIRDRGGRNGNGK